MALVGYARVSTTDQHLDGQLELLNQVPCDKIFKEKVSSVVERPQLDAMLDYVREGDTVVICKLDRIARSTKHLLEIVDMLNDKGVVFKVLNINFDTSTPTGKLMLSMLGAIAQFEREMMLERQLDGIRRAKLAGEYKGRKPVAMMMSERAMELLATGKTKQATADELGISIASVFRIVRANKNKTIT